MKVVNQTDTSSGTAHFGQASKTQEFRVSQDSTMMSLLSTGLYSNPKRTMLQEIVFNAWDAHKLAGITDKPIEIAFTAESTLIVKDFGQGIDPENIRDIYCVYGSSTKVDQDTQTGGFGLGSKSPFAYTNSFTVISQHNGTKSVYLVALNAEDADGAPGITKLVETPTEGTGLTLIIPLKDKQDAKLLADYIPSIFAFSGAKINLKVYGRSDRELEFPSIKENQVVMTTLPNQIATSVYAVYGGVIYRIPKISEYEKAYDTLVTIANITDNCVFIGFAPNTLTPLPSREGLNMSAATTKYIANLLPVLADKCMQDLNEEFAHYVSSVFKVCSEKGFPPTLAFLLFSRMYAIDTYASRSKVLDFLSNTVDSRFVNAGYNKYNTLLGLLDLDFIKKTTYTAMRKHWPNDTAERMIFHNQFIGSNASGNKDNLASFTNQNNHGFNKSFTETYCYLNAKFFTKLYAARDAVLKNHTGLVKSPVVIRILYENVWRSVDYQPAFNVRSLPYLLRYNSDRVEQLRKLSKNHKPRTDRGRAYLEKVDTEVTGQYFNQSFVLLATSLLQLQYVDVAITDIPQFKGMFSLLKFRMQSAAKNGTPLPYVSVVCSPKPAVYKETLAALQAQGLTVIELKENATVKESEKERRKQNQQWKKSKKGVAKTLSVKQSIVDKGMHQLNANSRMWRNNDEYVKDPVAYLYVNQSNFEGVQHQLNPLMPSVTRRFPNIVALNHKREVRIAKDLKIPSFEMFITGWFSDIRTKKRYYFILLRLHRLYTVSSYTMLRDNSILYTIELLNIDLKKYPNLLEDFRIINGLSDCRANFSQTIAQTVAEDLICLPTRTLHKDDKLLQHLQLISFSQLYSLNEQLTFDDQSKYRKKVLSLVKTLGKFHEKLRENSS